MRMYQTSHMSPKSCCLELVWNLLFILFDVHQFDCDDVSVLFMHVLAIWITSASEILDRQRALFLWKAMSWTVISMCRGSTACDAVVVEVKRVWWLNQETSIQFSHVFLSMLRVRVALVMYRL